MRKAVQEVTSPMLQFCSATWGQGGLGRITGALPVWPVIAEVTELLGPCRGCSEEQPQQEWGRGLPARRAALPPDPEPGPLNLEDWQLLHNFTVKGSGCQNHSTKLDFCSLTYYSGIHHSCGKIRNRR